MSDLYDSIKKLCDDRGISGYRLCKDLGIQPSVLTDLKMGRKSSMRIDTANKIASYFGVSVAHLLGAALEADMQQAANPGGGFAEQQRDMPMRFAAYGKGDEEFTDEEIESINTFIEAIRLRRKKKNQ